MAKERALKLISLKQYDESETITVIKPDHYIFNKVPLNKNKFGQGKNVISVELDGIF